jgi:hypothetical protein
MTPAPSAMTRSGDPHGATCSWPFSSRDEGDELRAEVGRAGRATGTADRHRRRRLGRQTGDGLGQRPTTFAGGSGPGPPAVSASTTPPGSPTTRQHPSRHNRPTSARPYHSGIRHAGTVMSPHSSEARAAASDARRRAIDYLRVIPATRGAHLRPSAAVLWVSPAQPRSLWPRQAACPGQSRTPPVSAPQPCWPGDARRPMPHGPAARPRPATRRPPRRRSA